MLNKLYFKWYMMRTAVSRFFEKLDVIMVNNTPKWCYLCGRFKRGGHFVSAQKHTGQWRRICSDCYNDVHSV